MAYANGLVGVLRDNTKAAEWYRKAAEQGDATAQTFLAAMYESGRGVPQDDALAALWYRKAAQQGDATAQTFLGAMYRNGRGVPQDDVQAYAWFNIAAAQGKETARERRNELASSMTPDQLAQAQALSSEYFEKYVTPFRRGE